MVHPGKEEFLRYYPHFGITVDSSMNVEVKVTDLLQGRKFKYKSAFLGFLGGVQPGPSFIKRTHITYSA